MIGPPIHQKRDDLSKYTLEQLHACIMGWESIHLEIMTGILCELKRRELLEKEKEK